MIYETEILFRGKLAPIDKLSPASNRKIKMVCPGCGKHYERFAKVLFSTGNFLCQECGLNNIHKKTLEIGAKYNKLTVLGDYSTGRSKVKCDCGVVKDVDNWSLKSGKTKSCGCVIAEKLKEYRKKNPGVQSGENHPNWKGGISGDRDRFMSTNAYKEWRTEVFRRDEYKCVCCDVNSNTLEAHHILPYASNEDMRTDVSNGVTMCRKHHSEFHSTYGRASIGKEELEEFLRGFKSK